MSLLVQMLFFQILEEIITQQLDHMHLYQCQGYYNCALGSTAGYNIQSGSNNIMIANQGLTGDNRVIRIGT